MARGPNSNSGNFGLSQDALLEVRRVEAKIDAKLARGENDHTRIMNVSVNLNLANRQLQELKRRYIEAGWGDAEFFPSDGVARFTR